MSAKILEKCLWLTWSVLKLRSEAFQIASYGLAALKSPDNDGDSGTVAS